MAMIINFDRGYGQTPEQMIQSLMESTQMALDTMERKLSAAGIDVSGDGDTSDEDDKNLAVDYILESGTDGIWHYEKKASGRFDLWCRNSVNVAIDTNMATNEYRTASAYTLGLPSFVKFIDYSNASFQAATVIPHRAEIAVLDTTKIELYFYSIGAYTFGGYAQVYIKGRWK